MNAQTKTTPATEPEIVNKLADALSRAQAKFPKIVKDKTANAGTYKYQYSDLGDLIEAVKGPLAENGLAHSERISLRDGAMVLITELMHISGESRESEWPLAIGKPQDMGSALTYGRRYSLQALLGVAAEQDDDGAAGGNATVQTPKKASAPTNEVAKQEPPKQTSGKSAPRPFALITGDGEELTFENGTDYLTNMEKEFTASIDKCGFWDSNQKTFEGWQAKLNKVANNPKAMAEFTRVGKEISETVFLLKAPQGA